MTERTELQQALKRLYDHLVEAELEALHLCDIEGGDSICHRLRADIDRCFDSFVNHMHQDDCYD